MTVAFSPALRLLVACAHWPRSAARAAGVRDAADALDDWPGFLRLVERHRMAALAADGLRDAGIEPPPAIQAELARAVLRDVTQALANLADTIQIAELFDQAGIPMAIIKGIPLSIEAFGEVAMRRSHDLDLLVEPATFLRARALLLDAKYEQVLPVGMNSEAALAPWLRFHKDITLRSPGGRLVELHQRLTGNAWAWPHPPRLADRAFVRLGGRTLAVLPEADRFVYLCLHGAHHAWVRLKWLADIAALLAGKDDVAVEALQARGEAAGLAVPVGLALLLVERVFGHPLPEGLARRLHRSRRLRLLMGFSLRMIAEPEEERTLRFSSTQIAAAQMLIHGGWRYRMTELRNVLVHWNTVFALGSSRSAILAAIALRPVTWIMKKARGSASVRAGDP